MPDEKKWDHTCFKPFTYGSFKPLITYFTKTVVIVLRRKKEMRTFIFFFLIEFDATFLLQSFLSW